MTALPVFGLVLMVLNDGWLRVTWPNLVTGKISDFAVVLFFPFLLTASWDWVASAIGRARGAPPRGLGRRRLLVALAITGLALAAINLSYRARDLYVAFLGAVDFIGVYPRYHYTVDASDLVALVFLPVAWWWGERLMRRSPR